MQPVDGRVPCGAWHNCDQLDACVPAVTTSRGAAMVGNQVVVFSMIRALRAKSGKNRFSGVQTIVHPGNVRTIDATSK
jgi:peroxiredoxin family protein